MKILYEAKGVILVHNEVGMQGENAEIFWAMASSDPNMPTRKMPVLEMHIAKNKFGPFKGREFLNFFPEQAKFIEPSEDDARAYRSALKA